MNVLVVPEDFRKDQYILKPIIRSLFAHLGCANAKVEVCRDPLLGGVSEALKWEIIRQILERYQWQVDIFLLCVDRDGSGGRSRSLRGLETQAREMLGDRRFFFGENAWQELEVWVLAGQTLPKDWKWTDVRADTHPKERFYLPFARQKGLMDHPAEGRGELANVAARNYKRIRRLCPEDIRALEDRVKAALGG